MAKGHGVMRTCAFTAWSSTACSTPPRAGSRSMSPPLLRRARPLAGNFGGDLDRLDLAGRGRRSDSIEWPLHNAHQPSRHEGLLRIVVPLFSARARMTLTGPLRPVDVAVEFFGKRPLTRLPAPGDPAPPLGNQPTYRSRTT